MKRTPFPAEMVLEYLENVLTISEFDEDMNDLNIDLFKSCSDFFSDPHNDWDVSDVEPTLLMDIIIAELLLVNKSENQYIRHVMDKCYYPWFNDTFFDPEPNPKLSIAGWINHSFYSMYSEEEGDVPVVSLAPVIDYFKLMIDVSPTSDELPTDYLRDVYLSLNEFTESPERWEFFYNECSDVMYNLNKTLNFSRPLLRSLRNSFEGDLPYEMGRLILNDLIDFKDTFTADIPEEDYRCHPLLLIANQLDDISDELYVD